MRRLRSFHKPPQKKSSKPRRKKVARAAQNATRLESKDAAPKPIWEVIIELGQQIPDEELATMPHDASINLDHYLYGHTKVNG